MRNLFQHKRGFGLVEALVGAAIISGSFLALSAVMTAFVRLSYENKARMQAAYLAEEGVEVMRYLRDVSWDGFAALSTSQTYDVTYGSGTWSATTNRPMINNVYSRAITVSRVYRDASGVGSTTASAGTLDPDSRFVIVRVSWTNPTATPVGTTTATFSTFLNKFF